MSRSDLKSIRVTNSETLIPQRLLLTKFANWRLTKYKLIGDVIAMQGRDRILIKTPTQFAVKILPKADRTQQEKDRQQVERHLGPDQGPVIEGQFHYISGLGF